MKSKKHSTSSVAFQVGDWVLVPKATSAIFETTREFNKVGQVSEVSTCCDAGCPYKRLGCSGLRLVLRPPSPTHICSLFVVNFKKRKENLLPYLL
jgi:hypothetical protein